MGGSYGVHNAVVPKFQALNMSANVFSIYFTLKVPNMMQDDGVVVWKRAHKGFSMGLVNWSNNVWGAS